MYSVHVIAGEDLQPTPSAAAVHILADGLKATLPYTAKAKCCDSVGLPDIARRAMRRP